MLTDRRDVDQMIREGGEGLPPQSPSDVCWLFTCCSCGNRWADPPSVVSRCSCGADELVVHRFTAAAYDELRQAGEVEDCPLTGDEWDRYKCNCGHATVRVPA